MHSSLRSASTMLWLILSFSLLLNLSLLSTYNSDTKTLVEKLSDISLTRQLRDDGGMSEEDWKTIVLTEEKNETDYADLFHRMVKKLPFHLARTDYQQIVRIYDFVWVGDKWNDIMESYSVCLSTQGSMDRIHWIPQVIQNWSGPLSLAVFVASPSEWVGLNLLVNHFRKCFPLFRDYVSIHVAVPAEINEWRFDVEDLESMSAEMKLFFTGLDSMPCSDTDDFIQEVTEKFKGDEEAEKYEIEYPQNHMRNVARYGCGTLWTFSTDIDIVPTPNAAMHLHQFISSEEAQNCESCAYVIPTFELDEKLPFPKSKKDIAYFWKEGFARPFHSAIFAQGHNATNYRKWAKTNLEDGPVKISHAAERKYMDYYEPFYVSPNSIPQFQERFIGYGFTRNSQIQESLVERWTFKVLTPIFTIHWGLQTSKTLLNPANDKSLRSKQKFWNSRIFKLFQKELSLRKKLKRQADYERTHLTMPMVY